MYAKKEVNNLFCKIAQKIILTNVLNVFLQNNNKLILWPPYHSDEYFGAPHESIPWLCIYKISILYQVHDYGGLGGGAGREHLRGFRLA